MGDGGMFDALKRALVGEMTWEQFKGLLQGKDPNDGLIARTMVGDYSEWSGDEPEVRVIDYGWLGWLAAKRGFPINVVIISPQQNSTLQLADIIKQLDGAEGTRSVFFKQLSDFTGVPHFMAESGALGLVHRKNIITYLPRANQIYPIAYEVVAELIANKKLIGS